jgi:hypothetical protein
LLPTYDQEFEQAVRTVCEHDGVAVILESRFPSTAVKKESKASHINSSVEKSIHSGLTLHTPPRYTNSTSEVRTPKLRERVKHELPFSSHHVVHRLWGKRRSNRVAGNLKTADTNSLARLDGLTLTCIHTSVKCRSEMTDSR